MVLMRTGLWAATIAVCVVAVCVPSAVRAGASAYDLSVFLDQPHPFAGPSRSFPEDGTPLYDSQIRAPARFPQPAPSSAAVARQAAQPTFMDRTNIAAAPGQMPAGPNDDDPGFIMIGAGFYDINDNEEAVEFRLEWRGGTKFLGFFKPLVGVMATTDQAVYGYAGILTDFYFGRRIVVTPSFAAGYYDDGDGKDLGAAIEFRSAIELGWRFDNRSRISAIIYHLSNAGIDDNNPGTEVLSIGYSYPLN
jgi:hypothetical protein